MKRDHALPLTDLRNVRPLSRGGDASPPTKRKSRPDVTKSVTRINQIAVSATSQSYTVENEEQSDAITHEPSRPPSVKASRPKATDLQRSQTAPSGLKLPRNNEGRRDAIASSLPEADVALVNQPVRPMSMQRSRTAKPQSPLPPIRHVENDDDKDEKDIANVAAPSAKIMDSKRPYGEMIDSDDVSKMCSRLGMSPKDVWCLRKEFNDEDTDNTNTITHSSFFYIIHEEKRALTKSILRLAGLTSPTQTRLAFDEFLRCVVAFASFSEPELLQFFFQVYSDNTTAKPLGASLSSMVESDLMKLGQDLQVLKSAFAGNVRNATSEVASGATLGTSLEGNWTFQEFERFSRLHQVAFYPLFQIQRNVRRAGELGEAYWVQKTSEKAQVQQMLVYMRQNHGFQPPLPLKERVLSFVLQRTTTQTRVRELAKKLYTG